MTASMRGRVERLEAQAIATRPRPYPEDAEFELMMDSEKGRRYAAQFPELAASMRRMFAALIRKQGQS